MTPLFFGRASPALTRGIHAYSTSLAYFVEKVNSFFGKIFSQNVQCQIW